jgi:hypothetical protein
MSPILLLIEALPEAEPAEFSDKDSVSCSAWQSLSRLALVCSVAACVVQAWSTTRPISGVRRARSASLDCTYCQSGRFWEILGLVDVLQSSTLSLLEAIRWLETSTLPHRRMNVLGIAWTEASTSATMGGLIPWPCSFGAFTLFRDPPRSSFVTFPFALSVSYL